MFKTNFQKVFVDINVNKNELIGAKPLGTCVIIYFYVPIRTFVMFKVSDNLDLESNAAICFYQH